MDDYCGLPFVTVFNGRMESMKIGEVVESLIQLKRDMDIYKSSL